MSESPTPDQQQSTPAGSSKALWTILFIVFMDLLGFGIILPQLPFFALRFHASSLQVGLLFAIYSLCQFLASPFLGMISDRFGRKPVLVFSQLGSAIGYAMLGAVTILHFGQPWQGLALLYLARVIDGISGGNISTAQAYISDVTTPAGRARGMGLLGAAFGIGFSVGPAMGLLVGRNSTHPALPAFVAAAFSFAAMLMSALWLKESNSHRPVADEAWLHPSRFIPILRKPVLAQLIYASVVTMTAFTMLEGTIGLYLNDKFKHGPHHDIPYGQFELSLYFAYIGVFIMYGQGRLMGQLVKKHGEWFVSVLGALLVSVGMSLYVCTDWKPVLPLLLIAGAINALGRSLQQPPIATLISKNSDRSEQGTVFGLYQGLSSLARSAGPVIATLVYAKVGKVSQFALAGVMTLGVAVWIARLAKSQLRPKPAMQSSENPAIGAGGTVPAAATAVGGYSEV
jgi:DHA1 family tetracycline resistance protein-like MFS transporter